MSYGEIYSQISNSAFLSGTLFLIAIALWILAIKKIERLGKEARARK